MIDDKKIEEAKDNIFNKHFLKNNEGMICIDHISEPVYLDYQIKQAIELGAKWAINEFLKDLWHDSKKEPEDNRNILIEHKCGNLCPNLYYHTEDYDCYYDDPWDVKVRISNITRWFYIDDLLPKGEK